MMRIRFSEIAKNELNDACDWYERQQAGLGLRFRRDVRESTLRIAASPVFFPVELEDVRRYVMNRFPLVALIEQCSGQTIDCLPGLFNRR